MGRRQVPMSVYLDNNRVVGAEDECWPWTGAITKQGYGHIRSKSRSVNAHRVAYEEAAGALIGDPSVVVRHTCDNKLCMNPAHLITGSQQDNIDDKVARGRQARGVTQAKAKLNDERVILARELWSRGATVPELSHQFGVAGSTIHAAVVGKTWTHVGH